MYKISPHVITSLSHAVRHYPQDIPCRWKLIAEYVTSRSATIDTSTTITLGKVDQVKEISNFDITAVNCRKLYRYLQSNEKQYLQKIDDYDAVFFQQSEHNGHKPIVIASNVSNCYICGLPTTYDSRPSFPVIYTCDGPEIAASYHCKCTACGVTYNYSYSETSNKSDQNKKYVTRIFNKNSLEKEYLQLSSQTFLSVHYLIRCHYEISVGGVSFEGCASIYNCTNEKKITSCLQTFPNFARSHGGYQLNKERLEEAWFLYQLREFAFEQDWPDLKVYYDSNVSHRLDIERCCRDVNLEIYRTPSKWIQHSCSVKGCKEGYSSIDGNQKMRRPSCAAPSHTIRLNKGMPKVIQCCPNSPITGNQSQSPKKFCAEHKNLEPQSISKKRKRDNGTDFGNSNEPNKDKEDNGEQGQSTSEKTITVDETETCAREDNDVDTHSKTQISLLEYQNFKPIFVESTKDLPRNDDSNVHVGCKKAKDIIRVYNRTAGILAMVKPCGIILDHTEMYTCESPSQVFAFLLRVCDEYWTHFNVIGYDRACEFVPFLRNLAKKGNVGAEKLLSEIEFLVDKFHCIKHKAKTCMPLENNPECKFHPGLPKFSNIHGVNTESAEQAFKWMNKFKFNVRRMTTNRFKFYLWTVINERNMITEKGLRYKGKL